MSVTSLAVNGLTFVPVVGNVICGAKAFGNLFRGNFVAAAIDGAAALAPGGPVVRLGLKAATIFT